MSLPARRLDTKGLGKADGTQRKTHVAGQEDPGAAGKHVEGGVPERSCDLGLATSSSCIAEAVLVRGRLLFLSKPEGHAQAIVGTRRDGQSRPVVWVTGSLPPKDPKD